MAVTDGGQRTLLPRCRVAASSLARLRGLLLATPQEAVDGLLLLPCDSIHTIGMAFPIDALFLDSGGEILECREAILPSRLVLSPYRTRAVLELDLDGIHRHALRPGQRLRFERLATAGDIPLDKP